MIFIREHYSEPQQIGNFRVSGPVDAESFPGMYWFHLRTCGQYVREQFQFDLAKKCVQQSIQKEFNRSSTEAYPVLLPPRCFVIPYTAPGVLYNFKNHANIILYSGDPMSPIVGLYTPESETIFLVENYDISRVYRHELQHFFMHKYLPEYFWSRKSHDGNVWKDCEPEKYVPSDEQKKLADAHIELLKKHY